MRKVLFLIQKEFRQILRNKFLVRAILMVPILQMLVLVPAVTFELKSVDLGVRDNDHTPESRALVTRLIGSSFFHITASPVNDEQDESLLCSGKSDMILIIPEGFGSAFKGRETPKVQVLADAVNATSAELGWVYINNVIMDYNRDIIVESGNNPAALQGITVTNRFWYNQDLNYKFYMLPGILVILITAIGIMLAGLNLVKEKESGTIEQINVTPVKKWELISSKVIPFFIIGLIDLAFGLLIGKLAFNIPFEGSILLLFGCAVVFLIAVLGLALFFSTFASTQQQYMFIAFFFILIFVLMSGIFTPTESMPLWAQRVDIANPVCYLMRINRMIMLKGSSFSDISGDLAGLSVLSVLFITFAVRSYSKRS
jgi:ABC-2 type transport system permease protein